jgi:glycerol-3-phosphate dehydrogenase
MFARLASKTIPTNRTRSVVGVLVGGALLGSMYYARQRYFVVLQCLTLSSSSEAEEKPEKRKVPPREQMKTDLKSKEYDLLIIGGGASGAGVAVDAVTRGNAKTKSNSDLVLQASRWL